MSLLVVVLLLCISLVVVVVYLLLFWGCCCWFFLFCCCGNVPFSFPFIHHGLSVQVSLPVNWFYVAGSFYFFLKKEHRKKANCMQNQEKQRLCIRIVRLCANNS